MLSQNVMRSASDMTNRLLTENDFPPVIVLNQQTISPFVFCCDHAGAEIPDHLVNLGVSAQDLNDHIAIDVGIFATTTWLAGSFNAPFVAQPFSRLVIDCNRTPENPTSIRAVYDGRDIPGNVAVSNVEREQRSAEIFIPYHSTLKKVIWRSSASLGTSVILVAMHSFSRVYEHKKRDCDIGVIFSGRQAFAEFLLHELKQSEDLDVRHNEPYEIDFDGDYTLPAHTDGGRQPYVELEICQDLIDTCAGQRRIARLLRRAFSVALDRHQLSYTD